MQFEFIGQSATDPDNTWASTSRLINCYRERVGGNFILKTVLGEKRLTNLSGTFCRAMVSIGGVLYVIQGGRLFAVSKAGVVTALGNVADSEETSISGNNGKIAIVAGGNYYVWDAVGETLTTPTAGAFSSFGSVSFAGQRTILTEKDGRRVQWSAVADATSLGGLDFATTESRDDDNLRVLTVSSQLWFFKERSIEPWDISTGTPQAIGGATIDIGLKAYRLVAELPNGVVFVGSDNKIYSTRGGLAPISTIPVETSIATESPLGVFYYQDEGHEICVFTFEDRPAWCYDLSTGEWHERASGLGLDPWTARAAAQAHGRYYVCNDTGDLSYLVRSNADNENPIVSVAIGLTVEDEGRFFRVPKLEFRANVGRNETADVALYVSKDRGQTYGAPKPRSLGGTGEYDQRVIYRALGQFRNFTPKLVWSGPANISLGATVYARVA